MQDSKHDKTAPVLIAGGGIGGMALALTLLAPGAAVVEIGHLEGWGGGLYGGPSVFSPWTRGNGHERFVTLVVAGSGRLDVTVGSARTGFQHLAVAVP